jgi:DNA-binding transcriptional regulator YiaG
MSTLRKILSAKQELPTPEERRRLREEAGFSVRAFANALGVSPSTVARWETGEREPNGPFLFVYVDGLRTLAKVRREPKSDD